MPTVCESTSPYQLPLVSPPFSPLLDALSFCSPVSSCCLLPRGRTSQPHICPPFHPSVSGLPSAV